MKKNFLTIFLFLIICVFTVHAKTRQQVVTDALAHQYITSWTASTNTYTFAPDMIFRSKYSVEVSYAEWPYVYGGREDDGTTTSRINGGTCPGGALSGGKSTKDIYDWWAADPSQRLHPATRLAGIDCIGFVMRMGGITSSAILANTNVRKFRDEYSIPTTVANLKPGDLLIIPDHARMVTNTSPLTVAEAIGQNIQRVIVRSATVGSYTTYTPFPVFSSFTVANQPDGSTVSTKDPEVKITIKSGPQSGTNNNKVKASSVKYQLYGPNGFNQEVTGLATTDAASITVSHEFTNLVDGDYTLYVDATNQLGFDEDQTYKIFHFTISGGGAGTGNDTTKPTGSVSITDKILYQGNYYITDESVSLEITATDKDDEGNPKTVNSMRFSNDRTNWSGWYDYNTSYNGWPVGDLSENEIDSFGYGIRKVYTQFKDEAGNIGSCESEQVKLDPKPIWTAFAIHSAANGYVKTAGEHTIELTLSEPARSKPTLSYTPYGKSSVPVTLSYMAGSCKVMGATTITSTTGNGRAVLFFSAVDYAGNPGTEITPNSFVINIATSAGGGGGGGGTTTTVTNPADDETVTTNPTHTITGTTEPDSTVEIYVDGVLKWQGVATGGTFSALLENLPEGMHTITIVIVLPSGERVPTITKIIVVDLSPPVVQIAWPDDGYETTLPKIIVEGGAGDSVSGLKEVNCCGVNIPVGEETIPFKHGQNSVSFPLPVVEKELEYGNNTLTLTATDMVGHSTSTSITVKRVGVVSVGAYLDDYEFNEWARWKASAFGSPGVKVEVIWSESNLKKLYGTLWNFTIPASGYLGEDAPTVKFTKDVNGFGPFYFKVKAYEPVTNRLITEGKIVMYVPQKRVDPTFIVNPADETAPDSVAAVKAFTTDNSGAITLNYSVNYDGYITVKIYNSTGTVVKTILESQYKTAGNYQFIWDGKNDSGTLQSEGEYSFVVAFTDPADSTNNTIASSKVIIDNTEPTSQITELKIKDGDTNMVEVYGTATDTNFKEYRVHYSTISEGGVWTELTRTASPVNNGLLMLYDTAGLIDGEYILKLNAYDYAGNTSTATKTLNINRQLTGLRIIVGDMTQVSQNIGATSVPTDNPSVFVDDAIPSGAVSIGSWTWSSSIKYSGAYSHYSSTTVGASKHYFIHPATPFTMKPDESIVQYVYIDPACPPEQILLQFYTDLGDGEHRVYWGNSKIQTGGVEGTPSLYRMGPLPATGQWVRLKISPSTIGLAGKDIKGMLFATYNGRAIDTNSNKCEV